MKLLDRRAVLLGTAGAVAVAGGGLALASLRCDWKVAWAAGAERLFVAVQDIFDARSVGDSYAGSRGADAMASELLGREDLLSIALIDCPESRRKRLGQVFADDFRRSSVVVVNRWIVARSEVLVAGLWVEAGAPEPRPLSSVPV